jgi:hypothetical protein
LWCLSHFSNVVNLDKVGRMACWDVFGKFGLEDNFAVPFIYACLGAWQKLKSRDCMENWQKLKLRESMLLIRASYFNKILLYELLIILD